MINFVDEEGLREIRGHRPQVDPKAPQEVKLEPEDKYDLITGMSSHEWSFDGSGVH